MLFWVILATIIEVISIIGTTISISVNNNESNKFYNFLGLFLGIILRAIPIIAMWVLFAKI